MAKISSGLTLTTDYFMRTFYKDNRDASKSNGRHNFSKLELSYEDSRALKHASKRMIASDYGTEEDEDTEIDETTINKIKAFVTTYNNAIDSGNADDYETKHYLKQLKALGQKHSEELGELGITVESDGKLTINESLLEMADSSKVRNVFSDKNEFSEKSLSIAKKLNVVVHDNLIAQINGNGTRINITL